MGIVQYNDSIENIHSYRGKALWEEAVRRGMPMQSIRVFGKEIDAYEAKVGRNKKTIRFQGLPRLELKGEWIGWVDDKWLLKKRLMEAQIPVPKGKSFSSWKPLLSFFKTLEKPVIIKPQVGSRGRHTTTFIYTEEELKKAFYIAKQLCHWVVMEEHLFGSVYRGTLVNGKLIGILGGDPPRVTGNNHSTIHELIEEKNKNKREGVKDVAITPSLEEFISRSGCTLSTILPAKKTIDLSEKIGVNYGGASIELTEETHPKIKEVMEHAAKAVDDHLIGFDFIIPDVTADPTNQKWGIIECNSLPFINLHHYPLIGKPVNVAKYVWDLWEK